ncbi:MAG: 16S rRNA (guanine(527)-N(7))-methyltransferase RsmG [Rhodospirillaceae bacterium]|nr:16S rRNA (guanine(527)-N(7))-methyltransferase RsmG [Rhodospirillaceae bacterium]
MKHSTPYGPEAFQKDTGVSRETLDRLKAYADLLLVWNKKINLIGPSTAPDLWTRHMLDSAQLFPLIPAGTRTLVDLGSGAGFPGLVLGIMGIPGITLVESDQRKCSFLREAARIAGASVTVLAKRIEDIAPFPADVITARALAPVAELLAWSAPFLTKSSLFIFPKGQNVEVELTEAHKRWRITVDQRPSRTDPRGTILCIGEVSRVGTDQPADQSGR